MIQIRQSMFETNSSSSHTFMIPKNSIPLRIPSSINLRKQNYPEDSIENRICLIYNYAEYYGDGDNFIKYLQSKGVEVEEMDDRIELPCSHIFKNEAQLDKFLFGEDVTETVKTFEGGFPNKYNNVNGNPEDYDEIYISF
ncbi:MAG: hypothetical protein VZS44_08030 [Bacilli bacterium]|nr:hypothetical protein [Bacilli bacterium]